jgi:hypothetical protein
MARHCGFFFMNHLSPPPQGWNARRIFPMSVSSISTVASPPPVQPLQASAPPPAPAKADGDGDSDSSASAPAQAPLPPGQGTRIDQIA